MQCFRAFLKKIILKKTQLFLIFSALNSCTAIYGIDKFVIDEPRFRKDATSDSSAPTSEGVLVVTGSSTTSGGTLTRPTLWTLSPVDGHILVQDTNITVVDIAYDGSTDIWYLFYSKSSSDFRVDASTVIQLQSRKLEPRTGTWTILNEINVPPPKSPGIVPVGILNKRLIYLAFEKPPEPAKSLGQLSVVDISDPQHLQLASEASMVVAEPEGSTASSHNVVHLLAARDRGSSEVNGVLNLVVSSRVTSGNDAGDSVEYRFYKYTYNNISTKPNPPTINIFASNPVNSNPGFGYSLTYKSNLVVQVPTSGMNTALIQYDPSQNTAVPMRPQTQLQTLVEGNKGSINFSSIVTAECSKIAFVFEAFSNYLYAIPLEGGTTQSQKTIVASTAAFDPFTNTFVLAPDQSSGTLTAFTFTPNGSTWLTQKSSTVWNSAPKQIKINLMKARAPFTQTCP